MLNLNRTQVGQFNISNSISIEEPKNQEEKDSKINLGKMLTYTKLK